MSLPKKRHYYIETLWSHYEHSHHIEGLEATRDVIAEKYPEYLDMFDQVMKRRSAHMFNIMIARSELFDAYTDWVMDILGEVEKRVDISNYNQYERRIFGFISELLVDVWVDQNQIDYTELPVMFIGNQHWGKKLTTFMKRKLVGEKNLDK